MLMGMHPFFARAVARPPALSDFFLYLFFNTRTRTRVKDTTFILVGAEL